jgi:hypothetical protein
MTDDSRFVRHSLQLVLLCSALLITSAPAWQTSDQPAKPNTVPVINGDLGPCSAEFTVKDPAGKPAAGAKVRVHIAYGFLGLRKLDLEVGTNTDGKARFEGLPETVRRPLDFQASQGTSKGVAVIDPGKNCQGEYSILMVRKSGD